MLVETSPLRARTPRRTLAAEVHYCPPLRRVLMLATCLLATLGACASDSPEISGTEQALALALPDNNMCEVESIPQDTAACRGAWEYKRLINGDKCERYRSCPMPETSTYSFTTKKRCSFIVGASGCSFEPAIAELQQRCYQKQRDLNGDSRTFTLAWKDGADLNRRYSCTVRHKRNKVHPSCGCARYEQVPDDNYSYTTSYEGLSREILDYWFRPAPGSVSCTSCDEHPPTSYQRRACLAEHIDRASPELRRELLLEARAIYELSSSSSQAFTEVVRSSYRELDDVESTCGSEYIPSNCNDEVDWRLNFCEGLLDSHVSNGAVMNGVATCAELFEVLPSTPSGACLDAEERALDINAALQEKLTEVLGQWDLNEWGTYYAKNRFLSFKPLEEKAAARLDADALHAYLDPMLAAILDTLYDSPDLDLSSMTEQKVKDTLGDLAERELRYAELVLGGIYSTWPSNEVGLGSWGQVNAVPQALEGLRLRLENFASLADLRCVFANCDVSEDGAAGAHLWTTLARLHGDDDIEPFTISGEYDATEAALVNGWSSALLRFFEETRDQELPAAVRSMLGPGSADLADLAPADVPTGLRRLHALAANASLRRDTYLRTGRFTGRADKRLHRKTNLENRQAVTDAANRLVDRLEINRDKFVQDFVSTVGEYIGANTAEAQLEALKAHYDVLSEAQGRLIRQKQAHESAISQDTSFDELVTSMSEEVGPDFEGELKDQFISEPDLRLATVNAHSSAFESKSQPLSEMQIHASEALGVGQMYSIEVQGSWSPTCALQKIDGVVVHDTKSDRLFDDIFAYSSLGLEYVKDMVFGWLGLGPKEVDLDFSNAVTGPEGFSIVQQQGQYYAESASMQLGISWFGNGFGDGQSSGTEDRSTASFQGGLRIPEDAVVLPDNDAPVGSLLVLEVPADGTTLADVRNVHVVQAPSTVIPVTEEGSRFVLVANDNCVPDEESEIVLDDRFHLTVNTSVVTGGDKLLGAFVEATADVVEDLRSQTSEFVERGEVLATDYTRLENEALLTFKRAANRLELPDVPFDTYPETFQRLFSLFVSREMNRLDRSVRISVLEHELSLLDIELASLATQVALYKDSSYLSDRLAEMRLGQLDILALQSDVLQTVAYMRDYMIPLFELWYPYDLDAMPTLPEVQGLSSITPFTTGLDYADKMTDAAREVADLYFVAANSRHNRFSNPTTLVLSIPNPSPCDEGNGDGDEEEDDSDDGGSNPPPSTPPGGGGLPPGPPPAGLWAGAQCQSGATAAGRLVRKDQAEGFWKAYEAARKGDYENAKYRLTIDPSLVYDDDVTGYRLACNKVLPIVRRMSFVAVRSGNSDELNDRYEWDFDFSGSQKLVTHEGVKDFAFVGAAEPEEEGRPSLGRNMNTALLFSSSDRVVSNFRSATHTVTASGISPFASFELDFSRFGDDLMSDLASVQQFVLVMEVEHDDGTANVLACRQ